MSFHRNGLRELVQVGRRERGNPLTVGELVERIEAYREDSKVILTNGTRFGRITRLNDVIHCDTRETDGKTMTVSEVSRLFKGWVTPGTSGLPLVIGEDRTPIIDVVDINGIFYLIAKERRV